MTKMHVHVIKMGGTIEFFDPSYDDLVKKLIGLDTSIENYFNRILKPHFSCSFETVAQKDSRELTGQDREELAEAIRSTAHENIVVTHGTFTMRDTAEFLELQNIEGKKIILTGSMIPITGFTTSDAGFNLGFAISSFASIQPGVYLSMNGGIFSSRQVEKNTELFRFE